MLKLHLGCGKRYIPGYVHIDLERLPHVDFCTSVDDLSMIESGSCSEVYASHVLEYFDFSHAKEVLKEWNRVLMTSGTLRLSVPNFESLVQIYQSSDDIDRVIGPLFGKIKIGEEFAYHKCVFTPNKLATLLSETGFKEISEWDTFTVFEDSDDHSKAFFPHMDFSGIQVSINMTGTKI